jgi:hypothetical protein
MSDPASWDKHGLEMVEFACAQAELLIAAVKRFEDALACCPDELAELRASVSVLEDRVIEPARRNLAEIKSRRGEV